MNILEEMLHKFQQAREQRPDVPPQELLINLFGEAQAQTFDETNASGQPMIFACLRCADARPDCIVTGSTKKVCSCCKEQVWMSPATEWSMNKLTNTSILCMQCVQKQVGNE